MRDFSRKSLIMLLVVTNIRIDMHKLSTTLLSTNTKLPKYMLKQKAHKQCRMKCMMPLKI